MDRYIATSIANEEKEAYEHAKYLNEEYVQNLRLKFLRADRFDVSMAGSRLVFHFAMKQELFPEDDHGGDILGRNICYSDLNDDDVARLEEGWLQILPERDTAGRTVVCVVPGLDQGLCGGASEVRFILLWWTTKGVIRKR